jgi:hypothetical protein
MMRRALLGLALAALLSGCEGNTGPRIIGDLLLVSGDNQSAKTGTQLAQPFVVKVVDDRAAGVPGVRIDWAVVIGNGTLTAAQTVTGTDGQTSIRATPTVGGQSAVTATIAEDLQGLFQVTFVMDGTL